MTEGHKHWMLDAPSTDVWWVRLLRRPLRHTTNTARVDPSPYPYGVCDSPRCPHTYERPRPTCYYLSLLGILHRWTGLTLRMPEE